MAITSKDLIELSKQTDSGMIESKKSLKEADCNVVKAI
mgnify:CR=1 FL=1